MREDATTVVLRDGNILNFLSLSSPTIVRSFQTELQLAREEGYDQVVLDFEKVGGVFPNACVPIAGIIEYYRSNGKHTFEFRSVSDFVTRTHMLAPLPAGEAVSQSSSVLNTVWTFRCANEIHRLVDGFLEEISQVAVCEEGVIQGLEWCVNEIMDNVIQHSETTHGYVMGQIHPATKHIAFCIYDYGQGLYNSLRNTQHAPQNALDSITIAVKEGVTRDKQVGQGNGMWGLYNIVRANSGILNIASGDGFLSITPSDTRTETNVPVLDPMHQSTTVDFQINYEQGISISAALGGYQPTNVRIEQLEDDQNKLVYHLRDKESGTGTRQSGAAIRTEIINLTKQTDSLIVLDFEGLSVISSSFADELIGKLAVEFGFIGFTQRFRLSGMNATIQAIANRSVAQRLGVGKGH